MNAPASPSTELVPLYADHLATMKRRADEALARGGFDHLVVPSGTQHWQVFDDRDYPYAVNPQFKAWLPLTRVPYSWLVYTPGQRPKVIFYQPFDYWHVVPDAPSGWWVDHVDVHIIRKPDEALALLPPAARSAILGEPQSALGDYAPNNPEPVIQYLEYQRSYKTPYEIALMRQAQRLAVRGHRAAEAAFRAGERANVDYKQLHVDAHHTLMGILKDFGVITVSPEAAVATGVSAAFFPHGLGHPIGLQVHDVAGFAASDRGGSIPRPEGHPYLRMTRVLEPGMVVTIEPGLYFIDLLLDEVKKNGHAASVDWARVDAFRPYGGIRIEDEVQCTDGNADNLTRPAFAEA